MESDDEVKGQSNSYTTEFRQYDPRLGRWLSLDPKMAKYPSESPYVAFHNNPIYWTDPLGDDPPEVGTLLSKGSNCSKTFMRLMSTADVTFENYQRVISYGERTATRPGTGSIGLNKNHSTNQLLIGLVHEFTNRSNLIKMNKLSYNVALGRLSPEGYAKGVMEIEKESSINQNIVAKELGIVSPFFTDVSERFNNGDISEAEMKTEMNTIFDNGDVMSGNTGEDIKNVYLETGKSLVKAYTELNTNYKNYGIDVLKLSEEEAEEYANKYVKETVKKRTINKKKAE
jgi:RHS repeat-associated protein